MYAQVTQVKKTGVVSQSIFTFYDKTICHWWKVVLIIVGYYVVSYTMIKMFVFILSLLFMQMSRLHNETYIIVLH